MAAAVKGLSLGGGLGGNRGQWLELKLGSFIPAYVQKPLENWTEPLPCELCAAREAVWSAPCRDTESGRECLTEEDMAEWSDRPWEEEAGAAHKWLKQQVWDSKCLPSLVSPACSHLNFSTFLSVSFLDWEFFSSFQGFSIKTTLKGFFCTFFLYCVKKKSRIFLV